MILNRVEFLMMNNPVRAWSQRIEWWFMGRGAQPARGGRVLEVGCGRGVGAEMALRSLEPVEYVGIDLDPRMVQRARKRVRDNRARFVVASADRLPFPAAHFDLALDFGILHHVPDYDLALAEIHRILKPGGIFLLEDLTLGFFDFPATRVFKWILDHPYDRMFTAAQFRGACARAGFHVSRWVSPRDLVIVSRLEKPA